MDRLNQLRGEAGDSQDSTLDTSSPPSEAFMSANESSSKYFSLSDVDSTFSISPSKDNTVCVTSEDSERTITTDNEIITNLSPIPKKSDADSFKIGEHIEAANILSGGVNIFDDNENSYDGDELVIDDNVILEEEKTNVDAKLCDDVVLPLEKAEDSLVEAMDEVEGIPSKDTEVVLQIDGKNVDAIDIGNGLYLYRKVGQDELAAVQIVDDDQQQPSFKFLKVRENTEGNLEVYEEIEVEIPKEVSTKDENTKEKNPHVPVKNINKVINETSCNKAIDKISTIPKIESNSSCILASEPSLDLQSELNINGKTMKFNESRKSPIIGTFTPMTYHSTPNKDGIPLTKTMVDLHLHPSRHSDNIKKTIEVHTESSKPKSVEIPVKTVEPNATPKIEELDNSIHETKENIIKSTAAEHKIDTEVIIKHSSNELKCNNASDEAQKNCEQNPDNPMTLKNAAQKNCEQNPDNPMTLKNAVDKTEYVVQNKEEHHQIADQKIQCINETVGACLNEEKQNDSDVCSTLTHGTSLPCTLNMKSIQCHENPQDNVKETSSIENQDLVISNINVTESDENKPKNITINHIKNQLARNLVLPENSEDKIIENKDIALHTEPVSDDKVIGKLPLSLYKKDDVIQLKDPIVNNDTCENSLNPSPTNVVTTFSENSIQNTNEKNITKDDLIIKQTSTSKSISETDTNNEMSDTALNVSKTKLNNSEDDLNTNMEIRFEGDDSGVILSNDEKTKLKLKDSQVASHNFNKKIITDTSVKEQANVKSTPPENPISLVMTQKHVPEPPATNNSDINLSKSVEISSSKVDTKNTNDKHIETRKEVPIGKFTAARPNSYNSAVPFGKWTEANRQEFLNKIKETKIHSNNSNTNQIKQTNDLNRRDILKKFDSQRNSSTAVPTKISELSVVPKFSNKTDTTFVNKSATTQSNPPNSKTSSSKAQIPLIKHKPLITKKSVKPESMNTELLAQRRVINSQDLIDKTIEGIITRSIKIKPIADYMKEQNTIHTAENPKNTLPLPGSLDDIEMKMNELHGISFIERPVKELPQIYNHDSKTCSNSGNLNINKHSKVPNLLPFKSKELQQETLETKQDDMSDEEILEHEPITGDVDNSKQNLIKLLSSKEKPLTDTKKEKETIITEKDFDQFARRNSKSYENCLTVNFDSKEQHNVVQTIVEKEIPSKKLSRNELMLAESKAKSSSKHSTTARHNNQQSKIPILKSASEDDLYCKNYQSKVQIAYQSALTDKIHREYPFTIIEDKPVKVVFMDTNTEFIPTQLNIQGQHLSLSKGPQTEPDSFVHSASESMDSDILDGSSETKSQDEIKSKSKHQRKQVFTPVEEEPEIQLIEPSDIENKVSPSKKRRIEDRTDKNSKNLVPKKSYLLNRSSIVEEQKPPKADVSKNVFKETDNRNDPFISRSNAISAIDNLVKAAELIETQSENNTAMTSQPSEIALNTPVKRGRGRPRKYPLPESGSDANKTLTPQKKPRLIDAKVTKPYIDSDESSDGEIKENWTMGKINENIVCPICDKLFRSENVVFKHVKHCTGPSPNRSDSDKRSPRRLRNSQESDTKLRDSGSDDSDSEEEKLSISKSNYSVSKFIDESDDVIIIEDISAKENVNKKVNYSESKKVLRKTKHESSITNHICEFCGKTFRQLSYLVSHKLQHKTHDIKKTEKGCLPNKSVFSCEICKKEFRKLHHLVQHRIIHNTTSVASRMIRKTSSERQENKISKTQNDDASAGFRCEPCDKSFRKLHHLVEHRETHDGINKKCNTSSTQGVLDTSKSSIVHHCDICKKEFKKLQDLVDHKEVHYETSSEKSDDKSVKSSLSTKDIIHECSLCYMVFPNEHSLNKHTVICLRKKKQSAAKQAAKKAAEKETESTENPNIDENTPHVVDVNTDPQFKDSEVTEQATKITENILQDDQPEGKPEYKEDKIVKDQLEERKQSVEPKPSNLDIMPKKRHSNVGDKVKSTNDIVEIPAKIKKVEEKQHTIPDTPTKKKINKEKVTLTVTKRHATTTVTLPVSESSDDNEIRYMLNPIYDDEHSIERTKFMKIRGLKRNSLQIERPKSKDLLTRRISLLHPPKMPRLKAKPIEVKPRHAVSVKNNFDPPRTEPVASTDSDDSDVKYSFPEVVEPETSSKPIDKKVKRQSLPKKRKSLSNIAKRKSLGKMATNKPTNKPRKRTTEVEHRCDCGQLFSSAALLLRHTTLAHTPPRIRKRRSPPPDTETITKPTTKPPNTKPAPHKPTTKPNKPAPKPTNLPKINTLTKKPKSVTNSNKSVGVATRKTSVNESKASNDVKCEFNSKSLRSSKRGIPESSRTLLDKPK